MLSKIAIFIDLKVAKKLLTAQIFAPIPVYPMYVN